MIRTAFKDHFSGHASHYLKYRPEYPKGLFFFLAQQANCGTAWDCATGNGQAAVNLSPYFDQVIATDASAQQIENAQPKNNISYRVCLAESTDIESKSIDLITIAQALHWLDLDRFYAETKRAGKEGALIAAWTYGLLRVNPKVDEIINHFYHDIVGNYWPPERIHIETGYESLLFPFKELKMPRFTMSVNWTLDQLNNYLLTWSSSRIYWQETGCNPLVTIQLDLDKAWGKPLIRPVSWPFFVKAGTI